MEFGAAAYILVQPLLLSSFVDASSVQSNLHVNYFAILVLLRASEHSMTSMCQIQLCLVRVMAGGVKDAALAAL